MLDRQLQLGQIVTNNDLRDIFKVGNMGGMRRSHATNSLVLVSDHTKGLYDDRWENSICYYTGMGMRGHQALASQNKTLYESNHNGVNVYLFEVHIAGQYRYHGQVKLAQEPFQEDQLDVEDKVRKVWVFPLIPIEAAEPIPVPTQEFSALEAARARKTRKLSNEDLLKHLSKVPTRAAAVQTKATSYYRSPYVIEFVRRRANGHCELCGNLGPFVIGDGLPFLEVHHVKWLAKNGKDTVENTVALCPNCHRKMHLVNAKADVDKLLAVTKRKLT